MTSPDKKYEIVDMAASCGDLDTLKSLCGGDSFGWDSTTFNCAVKGGHLDVLKWFHSQHAYPWNLWTCDDAAVYGQLEVLKWLRAQDPPCPWDSLTCARTAQTGQLEVLKWLRAQDPSEDAAHRPDGKDSYGRPCPWDLRVYDYAAENGHLEILKWLDIQYTCPPYPPYSNAAIVKVAQKRYLGVLKWIILSRNYSNLMLTVPFKENHYDDTCWLHQYNASYVSPNPQMWIQSVDACTNSLPLPSELIRLIKHYI